MSKVGKILRIVRLQTALLALISIFVVLESIGIIPGQKWLMEGLSAFFDSHGLPAVAACSLIENVAGLNVYFPGAIVILTAMSLSAGDPARALATFAAIVLPSLLAHCFNFFLGRLGKSGFGARTKNRNTDRVEEASPSLVEFVLALWHPHTGAIVSIRSGAAGFPFRQFLLRLIPVSLAWNSFWGLLMYFYGGLSGMGSGGVLVLIILYLIGWAAWDVWQAQRVHP